MQRDKFDPRVHVPSKHLDAMEEALHGLHPQPVKYAFSLSDSGNGLKKEYSIFYIEEPIRQLILPIQPFRKEDI